MANVIASFPCMNCKYEDRCDDEKLALKCKWITDHVLHSYNHSDGIKQHYARCMNHNEKSRG